MKPLPPLLIAILLFSIITIIDAQERRFFMPREIKQAYEKGTRSYDGKPGPAYWHNTVDYDIDVTVFPAEKKIKGSESVIYCNNSPDDLNTLVVRLYYDVFKKGCSREKIVIPAEINEGVLLKSLNINGQAYQLDNADEISRRGTNMTIQLRETLKSGQKLTMNAAWEQEIPGPNFREGTYDSTTFFIAYWYPQISVYDDLFGWDKLDYTFLTEFYNNLGNYDVRITAPKNFIVWATGELKNAEKVLPKKIHKRYISAKTSTEVVHVITEEDLKKDYNNLSDTWHYMAEEVSDFAFGLSDHFMWNAASQKIEERDVLINTVFPISDSEAYIQNVELQRKTMEYFSNDLPGVPYPYPVFTTFINGLGGIHGMEYPMMANNHGLDKITTIHELFHTYFPMYVRTNERRFSYLDEGSAEYIGELTYQHLCNKYNNPLFEYFKFCLDGNIGSIKSLSLITSTQFLDYSNVGLSNYILPGFVYAILHQHLGEVLFQKCLEEFIVSWAKKSPTPFDFFYSFENTAGQDLGWLWKPYFFEFGNVDLAIKSFDNGVLEIENRGSRPVPVQVIIDYDNGTSKEMIQSASVWKDSNLYSIKLPDYDEIMSLSVNRDIVDNSYENNFYPSIASAISNSNVKLSDDLLGVYNVKETGWSLTIISINDLLRYNHPRYAEEVLLKPVSENEFESLGGGIKVQFIVEDSVCKGLKLHDYWGDWTAQKQ